jgi:Glycosyl transferase family 11
MAVSFPAVGRLGNYYFECATALAYSLKHNLDFSAPSKTTDPFWSPLYLSHLVNTSYNNSLENIDLWENGHQYQELPFEESWRNKNIIVQGYRQSWKYFNEYRNEILYLFGHHYEKKENVISCHVRRGDYVRLAEKHPIVTEDYYLRAMAMFPGKMFKFFSDDMQWVKDKFGHRGDCLFSTNTNEVDDLVEASCCESNICSASTYSFWIYWLNRNPEKKGIFPVKWFTDGWMDMKTDDILPPEVIKI